MQQAWHIFTKDSRQFRYGIGLVLAWTALLAVSAPRWFELYAPGGEVDRWHFHVRNTFLGVSNIVLPAAWCVLIALVVHADPLAGDRQFWVTRPYNRASLFGAKVLFVLAYLVLPLMGVQAILLSLSDMPAETWRAGLVWNAILTFLMIALPALAIAAVTRSFVQFTVVAALSLLALQITQDIPEAWQGIDWVRTMLTTVVGMGAAGGILWIQFARRRTHQSRVVGLSAILIAVTILVAFPWRSAFALQAAVRPIGGTNAEAELLPPDSSQIPIAARSAGGPVPAETVTVALSARAVGIDPGTPLACDAMQIDIEGRDGSRWSSELVRYTRYYQQTQTQGICHALFRVPASYAGSAAVRLSGAMYVTATRESARVTLRSGEQPLIVDDVVCAARDIRGGADMFVECRGAFGRQDGLNVGGQATIGDLPRSYSPFPGRLAIVPMRSRTLGVQGETVPVFKQYPAGHTTLPLRPSTVRLADFVIG